ncbi:uncharacterized protein LOC144236227 [Crocuta crocuta]
MWDTMPKQQQCCLDRHKAHQHSEYSPKASAGQSSTENKNEELLKMKTPPYIQGVTPQCSRTIKSIFISRKCNELMSFLWMHLPNKRLRGDAWLRFAAAFSLHTGLCQIDAPVIPFGNNELSRFSADIGKQCLAGHILKSGAGI